MYKKKTIFLFALIGIIAAPILADSAEGPKNVGVWMCKSTRSGSGNRPAHYTFRSDGTAFVTSGSNIAGRGYFDRSSLSGEWKQNGKHISFRLIELYYNEFAHVSGRGFLEATAEHNQEDDTLDISYQITFTKFEYDGDGTGNNGAIVKEDFGDVIPGSSHCERMDDAFLVPFVP